MADPVIVLVSDPDLLRRLGACELKPLSRRKIVVAKTSNIIFIGGEEPLSWPIDERVLAEMAVDRTRAMSAARVAKLAKAIAKSNRTKLPLKPRRRSDPA